MRKSVIEAGNNDEDTEINLTPMLDVVFIMLIFFIVTASFVKEAGVDVNRPEAVTAESKQNANILIAISGKNEIWIDRKKTSIQGLRTAIEKLHSENPEGQVMIQADKESNAEQLLAVMDAARDVGVQASLSALVD